MEIQKNKHHLRAAWKKKRSSINLRRRIEAEKQLHRNFPAMLKNASTVLSYASFSTELSTWKLNEQLAKENRLVLPKVVNQTLELYLVTDLENALKQSSMGFFEPDPLLCSLIDPLQIDFSIIPGLIFDPLNMRLGYGKGLYDRLLSQFSPSTKTIGIGFYEQYVKNPIPSEIHDIPLQQVLLY